MKQSNIELGQLVKDKITGYAGIVTGLCEYISGCNQALIVPRVGKDGKRDQGEWFDVQRLAVTSKTILRLNNNSTPGPDREAPKR